MSSQPSGYESAPVNDDYRPTGSVKRPQPVDLAVKLMWAGAALSLLSIMSVFVTDFEAMAPDQLEAVGTEATDSNIESFVNASIITVVVVGVVQALLWALMAWANGRGFAWARIVATVLGIINILLNVLSLVGNGVMETPGGGALALILALINVVLAVVILALLWNKRSGPFFAARR